MALSVTLNWLRDAWLDEYQHFCRKLYQTDGSRAGYSIYGDGMWNTLYVLVEAYRFTGDDFYLHFVKRAWATLKTTAMQVPGDRQGLFHPLLRGHADLNGRKVPQDGLINVMLTAHEAIHEAGGRDNWFLEQAEWLANLALSKFDRDDRPDARLEGRVRPYLASAVDGPVLHRWNSPGTLVRLALARSRTWPHHGLLYRVAFRTHAGADLRFIHHSPPPTPSQPGPVDIHVEDTMAVIYMDHGHYDLWIDGRFAQVLEVTTHRLENDPIVVA